jgi:hypothetical protein
MNELEQAILEAAEKNDDSLDDLLQIAIEQMDEEQAVHLLDKVTQIMKEGLRDARGWK